MSQQLDTPVSQTQANPPQANPQAKEVPKSTSPSKQVSETIWTGGMQDISVVETQPTCVELIVRNLVQIQILATLN